MAPCPGHAHLRQRVSSNNDLVRKDCWAWWLWALNVSLVRLGLLSLQYIHWTCVDIWYACYLGGIYICNLFERFWTQQPIPRSMNSMLDMTWMHLLHFLAQSTNSIELTNKTMVLATDQLNLLGLKLNAQSPNPPKVNPIWTSWYFLLNLFVEQGFQEKLSNFLKFS